MAYRNKTYVAFDADNDIHYYRLMQAWKQNDKTDFNFFDAHDLNRLLPTSNEVTIKRKLGERLRNSKTFIILIGKQTRYLYKFVKWEMEQAITLDIPIIGVNLNGKRKMDPNRCPPVIREKLAIHVSFNARIVQYALENWEVWHFRRQEEGKSGPFYYKVSIYEELGLL